MCHFLFLFSPKKLTVNVIGYLFQALSIFSFVCWAAPNNVVVNQLFGVRSGLGMSFLTFDWTQIAWIGSPLMFPWWAQLNTFVGFVLFVWILTPVLYYTNVSNTHTHCIAILIQTVLEHVLLPHIWQHPLRPLRSSLQYHSRTHQRLPVRSSSIQRILSPLLTCSVRHGIPCTIRPPTMYLHPRFVAPQPDPAEWAQAGSRGGRHTRQTYAALVEVIFVEITLD